MNAAPYFGALLAAGLFALVPSSPADDPTNLVYNGDFSLVRNGAPEGWEAAGDSRRVTQSLSVVSADRAKAARLTCTRIEGAGGAVHAMLAQVGRVRLEAGRYYELRFRARHEGMAGRSVSVAITDTSVWSPCGLERSVALGSRWQEYRIPFRASRTVGATSRLQFWFLETGTLYVADVALHEAKEQAVEYANVAPAPVGANLIPNGGFELGGAGWSSHGIQTGWGNLAHLHGTTVLSRERGRFLRIPMGEGRTPVLGFDYFHAAMTPQLTVCAAPARWIRVEPGAVYTLAADMRASVADVPAVLGYVASDPSRSAWDWRQNGNSVRLSTEWRRYTWKFTAPAPFLFVQVGPALSEDLWVDVDVDNVTLSRGEDAPANAVHSPIEVAVEPAAPAGAFPAGQVPELIVRAANAGARVQSVTIRLEGRDFQDRAVRLPETRLTVPPQSTVQRSVGLPALRYGWYAVRVSASGSAPVGVVTPEVRLSMTPPQPQETFLGMNHAFPDPWLIGIARRAGVSIYRDWSLKWDHIEPQPGVYRWDLAAQQVDRVLSAGAFVMCLLPPFPSSEWVSTAPAELRAPGYPGERMRQAWAPSEPRLLADFAQKAVERFRDRVRVWEFLNEPIYTDYSLPRPHYQPQDYLRLLRPVAAAIKKADPGAKVMGGAGAGAEGVTMDMIEGGLLEDIDLLNLHIYPGMRAPEGYIAEMGRLLAEMDRRGARRPIWITEFSYYGVDNPPRRPFLPAPWDWAEERLLLDERMCADYTVRFCAIMLTMGCEKVFLHSGSSGTVNRPAAECCLFDYGGAPRKVATALGVMASLLGEKPEPLALKSLPGGVYVAAFETGRRSVAMIWATEPGKRIRLPVGAKAMDIVGRPLQGAELELSETPLYLLAAPGKADTMARLNLR